MSDQNLTNILAGLVRQNAARGPLPNMNQVTGLSNAILSGIDIQKPYESGPQLHGDPRGPSFVNRILDIMSRPLYGVLTPAKKELEENVGKAKQGDFLGAVKGSLDLLSPITHADDILAGLSGKEKTTGRDLLKASTLDQHL